MNLRTKKTNPKEEPTAMDKMTSINRKLLDMEKSMKNLRNSNVDLLAYLEIEPGSILVLRENIISDDGYITNVEIRRLVLRKNGAQSWSVLSTDGKRATIDFVGGTTLSENILEVIPPDGDTIIQFLKTKHEYAS